MELFASVDTGFEPEDGEKILPARNLGVISEGNLLRVCIVNGDGEKDILFLTVRGEGRESREK